MLFCGGNRSNFHGSKYVLEKRDARDAFVEMSGSFGWKHDSLATMTPRFHGRGYVFNFQMFFYAPQKTSVTPAKAITARRYIPLCTECPNLR